MAQPSADERVYAALAHASILTNIANLVGVLVAGVIWSTQRERSAYVRGHALQALVYQIVVVGIELILLLFWIFCLALSLLPLIIRPDLYTDTLPGPFWIAMLIGILPLSFAVLAAVYGLVGAYDAYRGRPFFYPLVGRVARSALAAEPAITPPPSTPEDAPSA